MADTAHKFDYDLERPHVTPYEKLFDTAFQFGADLPDPADIDLEHFNIADREIWRQDKFHQYFARMRKEAPVHWCPPENSGVGGFWSLTKYKDIMEVDINWKDFSSSWEHGGIVLGQPTEGFELPMFIAMDPPKHDVQRKTVQGAVGPAMLKKFEPLIRERTQKVLDDLPVGEAFDWVDRVSIELTAMMLATLFGVDQKDRRKLTHWSDITTGRENPDLCPGGEEQWKQELLECLAFFTEHWNDRINKEPVMDLISMLAHGENTRNMEPMEYLGNVILLIVGGNDTTRNSMSASVRAMNLWPDQFEKLKANQDLIPNMVSEVIRWQTPLAHMRRTAVNDVEIGGKLIKKGDMVGMWYASGNRDEDFWDEDPNRVIIDRKQARNHISFGFGIHRCVGNRLGEMQLRVLWEELLARFDRIEMLDAPSRTANSFVNGYTWMPVMLHPK